MAKKYCIVAMVEIETTDERRLDPERLSAESAASAAALRNAVMKALKRGEASRLIVLQSVSSAKLMCAAHDAILADLDLEDMIAQPPPGYIPPTRD